MEKQVAYKGPVTVAYTPTVSTRIQELQAEARKLAREHIGCMMQSMNDLATLAQDIAKGGEVYPAGVRSVADTMREDLDSRRKTLESILVKIW